jgi:hypothetical protein
VALTTGPSLRQSAYCHQIGHWFPACPVLSQAMVGPWSPTHSDEGTPLTPHRRQVHRLAWANEPRLAQPPSALPAVPGMVMVTPVSMRIPVVAPTVVSPIIVSVMMVTVVAPAHYDDRGGSDHDEIATGVGRLG